MVFNVVCGCSNASQDVPPKYVWPYIHTYIQACIYVQYAMSKSVFKHHNTVVTSHTTVTNAKCVAVSHDTTRSIPGRRVAVFDVPEAQPPVLPGPPGVQLPGSRHRRRVRKPARHLGRQQTEGGEREKEHKKKRQMNVTHAQRNKYDNLKRASARARAEKKATSHTYK